MSTYNDASLIYYPSGYKASKAYSLKPTDGSGDLTFTRASTATRVNSSGLIESVATGVPRIDYTGGGCGKLLLEPQRTNLLLQSEAISTSPWILTRSNVTTNNTTSPSGTATADVLFANGTGSLGSWLRQVVSAITGAFSMSIYAKQGTSPFLQVRLDGLGAVIFDLSNGTIKASSVVVGSIVSVGSDGWYRCTISGTATGQTIPLFMVGNSSMTLVNWFTTLGDSLYLWGAQLESGSYPTSYIPTTTTAVTRVGDLATAQLVSSGVWDGESGTIFIDIEDSTPFLRYGSISSQDRFFGVTSNYVGILSTATSNFIYANTGGFLSFGSTSANKFKFAITFNSTTAVLFINGVKVSTNSKDIRLAIREIYLSQARGQMYKYGNIQLYQDILSDAQLIELTTI